MPNDDVRLTGSGRAHIGPDISREGPVSDREALAAEAVPSSPAATGWYGADKGGDPPRFSSILYLPGQDEAASAARTAPTYFHDLNLDQVVASITAGKDDYDLAPFFYTSLKSVEQISYRHEVMQDLEVAEVTASIDSFANAFRKMRENLTQIEKLYYKQQKERWFLHAVEIYCPAVQTLHEQLARANLSSRGLRAFRDYLGGYIQSDRFAALCNAMTRLQDSLALVHYCIQIRGDTFKVRKYEEEQDYSVDIVGAFKKFQQGATKNYLVEFHELVNANHIEAKVLEFVALLYPQLFTDLEIFVRDNQDFADPTLVRFDREIQFYTSYVDYIHRFRQVGLRFCYPSVSPDSKEIEALETFDLALATKLLSENASMVINDFHLRGPERIFIVSGPNQGGKTTFARMFGQLHHLASIGCPVAGGSAQLYLFDAMFTHFEREEDIKNLHGKLQDDLVRIHEILEHATPRSIVVINEIFNSTTLRDAVFLARKMMDCIIGLDLLCVCVTFLDELASLGEKTVSMVSTVVPDNPAVRTFKLLRRPADGRAYAISIAEKHRLTYEWVRKRVSPRKSVADRREGSA